MDDLLLGAEEGKQLQEFLGRWSPSVFAEFECLGVLDYGAFFFAVELYKPWSKSFGDIRIALLHSMGQLLFPLGTLGTLLGYRDHFLEIACGPVAFDLRFQFPESVDLLIDDGVNANDDFRVHGIGLLKTIFSVKEYGVFR